MSAIRNGSRVCLIMSMQTKGTVIEVFEKHHKTMMVDGPLSKTMWAKVQLDKPTASEPILLCRIGDLMIDE